MRLPVAYHEALQSRQAQGEEIARHGASFLRMMARSLYVRDNCKNDPSSPDCEKPTGTQTTPIVLGAVYVSPVPEMPTPD